MMGNHHLCKLHRRSVVRRTRLGRSINTKNCKAEQGGHGAIKFHAESIAYTRGRRTSVGRKEEIRFLTQHAMQMRAFQDDRGRILGDDYASTTA